jgi:hypothetical protein
VKRWAILLSLLVFAGSLILWVRSYLSPEAMGWSGTYPELTRNGTRVRGLSYVIGWAGGSAAFHRNRYDWPNNPYNGSGGWGYGQVEPPGPALVEPPTAEDRFNLRLAGFQVRHFVHATKDGWQSDHHVVIPLWLFLPAAIPPVMWWRRRKGRARGFPVRASSAGESLTAAAPSNDTQRREDHHDAQQAENR